MRYLVNLLNHLFTGICAWRTGHVRVGRVLKGSRNFTILREAGRGARREGVRLLAGPPAHAVIMTFITHEFSGGPWTSAVQGPK